MSIVDTITANPIPSLLTTIFAGVVIYIINYEYRRQREATDDVKEWYRDSLALIGQLQQIGHQTTEYQQHDTQALREKLDPLAADLRSHADTAPEDVPQEARKELTVLSAFSTGLINITGQYEDLNEIQIMEKLQEHVRENSTDKYNINEVNKFLDGVDVNDLAERMDERSRENGVEVNEDVLEDMAKQISDESIEKGQIASIEDAAEFPFDRFGEAVEDDEFVEELIDDTMRTYSRFILLKISSDVYRAMETRLQHA